MFGVSTRKVKKLVKLVEESNIGELEDSFGFGPFKTGVKIKRDAPEKPKVRYVENKVIETALEPPYIQPPVVRPPEENYVTIKSPMVGTFYRVLEPGAKPYVELNQQISVGQVVCMIRAMKLNNEIESEISGRVTKILVENDKPVEWDQPLFLIEPVKEKK